MECDSLKMLETNDLINVNGYISRKCISLFFRSHSYRKELVSLRSKGVTPLVKGCKQKVTKIVCGKKYGGISITGHNYLTVIFQTKISCHSKTYLDISLILWLLKATVFTKEVTLCTQNCQEFRPKI